MQPVAPCRGAQSCPHQGRREARAFRFVNDAEHHLAETFDGFGAGFPIGLGDAPALVARQLAFQFLAAVGQIEQALTPVLQPRALFHELPIDQLFQDTRKALLRYPQNAEQLGNRGTRIAADEIDHPMVGAPETILGQNRVRPGGEVAIGEEQQLHRLIEFLLSQKQRIGHGVGL